MRTISVSVPNDLENRDSRSPGLRFSYGYAHVLYHLTEVSECLSVSVTAHRYSADCAAMLLLITLTLLCVMVMGMSWFQ